MARMTPRETAAYKAGIHHAVDMALASAITIEIRDDANHVRQRAAIEALRGLANGLKAAFLDKPPSPDPMHASSAIAVELSDFGEISCSA